MNQIQNRALLGVGLVITIIIIGFLMNPIFSPFIQRTYHDDLYIRFSTWNLNRNDVEIIYIIDVNNDGEVLSNYTLNLSTKSFSGQKNYFVGDSDYSKLREADFILVYTADPNGDYFDEWDFTIGVFDNGSLMETPTTALFGGEKDESSLHKYLLLRLIGEPLQARSVGGKQHNGVLLANKSWNDLWIWLDDQESVDFSEFIFPLDRIYW